MNSFEAGNFDRDWYLHRYPDVARTGMDPLLHYRWVGQRLGRAGCASETSSHLLKGADDAETKSRTGPARAAPFDHFGIIHHVPLISVIVVSYNSGKDLPTLFASLRQQTYRPLEVILVENGDEETDKICGQYFDNFIFLKPGNVGFAEANNIAFQQSSGELIALVNPDTRLEADCLQQLLDCLRTDSHAAVAAPKIRFFERFIRLSIDASVAFSFPCDDLLEGLKYRKLFIREGDRQDGVLLSNSSGRFVVDLPYEAPRTAVLQLKAAVPIVHCELYLGHVSTVLDIYESSCNIAVTVQFDERSGAAARHMINNAGSVLDEDDMPYDRAFGQFDYGDYQNKEHVSAFCGCAALIRRIAIVDRDMFVGEFFAYYEDSELSHYLGKQGYKIVYQPEAKLYHRHSESTEEHSLLWNTLVGRSRALYDILTERNDRGPQRFYVDYAEGIAPEVRRTLVRYDQKIRQKSSMRALTERRRKTACVYNSFFSTMGGGEKHALEIAAVLSEDFDVYLVSETDFDIEKMSSYFDTDLKNVKKLISSHVDTHFSSKFDLFINSSFCSNLVSAAKQSAYIVSFPHWNADPAILSSYKFLHNSSYTQGWASNYWGQHDNAVVHPVCGFGSYFGREVRPQKERSILCVGRFTYGGHCKNHHYVIAAFKDIVSENPDLADWTLTIAGSYEPKKEESRQYYWDLLALSDGYGVEVIPNETRENLESHYEKAAVYVHAAGLDVEEGRPDLREHFGIACYEAILFGCAPLVYRVGGPAEQVAGLPSARTFDDHASLRAELLEIMRGFDTKGTNIGIGIAHARQIYLNNIEELRTALNIDWQ